jgi:hypothetical protein
VNSDLEKQIAELDRQIAVLPDEMEIKETLVPMRVTDPKDPKKKIDDPHGRISQRRMDIFDKADPFKKPILHWHTLPDHQIYTEDWAEISNVFVHMKSNLKLLKEKLLEGKSHGTSME